jgi:hypothetical protein
MYGYRLLPTTYPNIANCMASICSLKSLKIPKGIISSLKYKTDKTMAKRNKTKQWPNEDRQNNGQTKTDKTMAKRRQTKQWPNEDRQNNGQTK